MLASAASPSSPVQLAGQPALVPSEPGHAYSDLGTALASPTMRKGLVHEWYTEKHVPPGSVQPTPPGDPSSPILSVIGFDRWSEQRSQMTFGMFIVMVYGVYVVGSYNDGLQQSLCGM